jgi:hypothetical protein
MNGLGVLPLEQLAKYRIDVIGTADFLHREVRMRRFHVLIGKPEALVLPRRDLDIGVIAHQRHQLADQQLAADGGIRIPVIAIGCLRGVDVPGLGVVALGDHIVGQVQRAGDHGAAGFAGVEELLFVHLLGNGVVTNEHHVDLVVIALQKQVQQDEEALGQVLAHLIHGARHIHDADHHGLAGWLWQLGEGLIAQVEGVDERQRGDARLQPIDLLAQGHHAGIGLGNARLRQFREFLLQGADAAAIGRTQRGAPGDRAFERAHDIDIARGALGAVAGAHGLELGGAHQLIAHQIGQFQVVEQQVEKLLPRQLEDEVVLALATLPALP